MEVGGMLKKIPLFSTLDDNGMNYLKDVAIKRSFPKNTILFSRGDESDALYLLYKGSAKAIINDETGKEIVLSTVGPGEYFGEISFLDGEARSATVVTREPVQVLIVYKNDFKKILFSNPDIVFRLLKELLNKLRRSTEQIESLAFMDVYKRIANLLLQLAEPQDAKWVIEEKLTHQEISNRVGSSREMVSRIMKQLQTGGYISTDRKKIIIHKKLPVSF
jgi:CRP/FNR family cyclic AMP-dependent transcriptional regulator